ncbi:MAG: hypothetical protein LBQ28_01900 [Prevotellaceae bacterium]|jgi:hypothetical protein|nr:hypothetical protein [Prevotellaceae bacterium]
MKMKNIVYGIFVIFACLLLGCSKDEDNSNGKGTFTINGVTYRLTSKTLCQKNITFAGKNGKR